MTEETTAAPAAATTMPETTPEVNPATQTTLPDPTAINDATAETQTPTDKDVGGLVFPETDDAEAILNFRKACGYPEAMDGYGLPMESDEQKDVLSFIHRCQLDKVAAKTVVDNLAVEIAEQEKKSQAQYDADYAKVASEWGDNKKANENYLSKAMSVFGLDGVKLRGISEHIGVEAALKMMMTLGKLNSDYSGVGGNGGGSGGESIIDFVAQKRGR